MILRSLTKHVRDQNWFAVGLDFAIVVIGVFIGIQVANWNELQAERGQTERMLSDLIVDLEEMRENAAYQSDDYLKLATLTDNLLDSLEAGDEPVLDKIAETFDQILVADIPPILPAGVNELLVAGRLDLLSDAPVRDALNNLSNINNLTSKASTQLYNHFRAASAAIRPYVTSNRTPDFDFREERHMNTVAVDTEALWSDPKARVALTRLYSFHGNMRALSQVTERAIDDALDAVPRGAITPGQ